MIRSLPVLVTAIALVGASACGFEDDAPAPTRTGVALTMDVLADTDVSGLQLDISSCPGTGSVALSTYHDLENLLVSGTGPDFGGSPLSPESGHLFVDHFTTLAPGCYDVVATPLADVAAAIPSSDCARVSATGIGVVAEQTTEIFLISQCVGPDTGALDTVVALNHPPTIDSVTFEPSKWICAGDSTEICVTASDVDGDPLEFELSADIPVATSASNESFDGNTRTVTQCWVTDNQHPEGAYRWTASVWDLLADGMRIEDYLRTPPTTSVQDADPTAVSHTSLSGPVYVVEGEACVCATDPDLCTGTCLDTDDDGVCDVDDPCPNDPANLCVECPSGQVDCGAGCVDVMNDPNHCGACGLVCQAGDLCTAGTCSSAGLCLDDSDCSASNICMIGVCDPDTGVCSESPVMCPPPTACHSGACDPAAGCVFTQFPGTCVIAGQCFSDGDVNPNNDCQVCDPAANPSGWTSTGGSVTAYYADADADGFGSSSAIPEYFCSPPGPGYVTNTLDCDDSRSFINPSANEVCGDPYDNDCDGDICECVVDGQCGGSTPLCDVPDGECVECLDDSDCSFFSNCDPFTNTCD